MHRYFFNVYDGKGLSDSLGEEFADVQQAVVEALRLTGEILTHEASQVSHLDEWRLEVTDERGNALFDVAVRVGVPASQEHAVS